MKKILAVLVMSAGLVVFGFTFARAVWYSPDMEITDHTQVPASSTAATAAGKATDPVRLTIPTLSVDANIQKVGIAKSGNMAVPTNYTDVGWYKYGPSPGEAGSAVMDGHVDNGVSLPGVFKGLSKLKEGDSIYIYKQNGTRLRFVVSEVAVYPYHSVPSSKVFAKGGASRIALITCDGAWIQGEKTYDSRLVVYATLQP